MATLHVLFFSLFRERRVPHAALLYLCLTIFLSFLMHSILQWNCRGFRTSASDLQTVIGRHRPIAIGLQETKLAPDWHCSIKGYSVFRQDVVTDSVAHGGVLLGVHHSVPTKRVPLSTSLQAVAVRIDLNRRPFTLCSIYLPPDGTLPVLELRRLTAQLPGPLLLLGDFNAHHTVWGCRSSNARGRALESFINEESLCLLNTGTRTHVTLPLGQTSVLDLSLTSPQLAHHFTWTVADDPLGSDHFPVWLRFQGEPAIGPRPRRWNLRTADWVAFRAQLDEVCCSESICIPGCIESFTSAIISAAEGSIPRTSGTPRRIPVPWWTDACRDAIRARRRSFRKFDRHSSTENLIAFRKARAFAKRTIQEAKRVSWREYVSRLNRFTPMTQVWSQIKRISGQFSSTPLPVLHVDGHDILSPSDVANEIGRALCNRFSSTNGDAEFLRHKHRCEANQIDFSTLDQLSYNQPFTLTELKSAVDKLRNVAEGPDGVHNCMIKELPTSGLQVLLSIFNKLWETGEFPSAWREALVVPVLKPGKSGEEPLHYRPISLTSSLCKVMERLVNVRFC